MKKFGRPRPLFRGKNSHVHKWELGDSHEEAKEEDLYKKLRFRQIMMKKDTLFENNAEMSHFEFLQKVFDKILKIVF